MNFTRYLDGLKNQDTPGDSRFFLPMRQKKSDENGPQTFFVREIEGKSRKPKNAD